MNFHEVKLLGRRLRKRPTNAEIRLWAEIRDRQVDGYKFLRQHPIVYDRNGNELNIFIPDFYCPVKRLAIEVDGGIHDLTVEYDQWREKILTGMNIRVLRFRNSELENMEAVVQKIRLALILPNTPPCSQGRAGGG